MILHLTLNGEACRVRSIATDDGAAAYEFASQAGPWQRIEASVVPLADGTASILLANGESLLARLETGPLGQAVMIGSRRFAFAEHDPRSLLERRGAAESQSGPTTLTSPMPGRIVKILLEAGSAVGAKQGVLMVEAMKMQNELKAPRSGTVETILVAEGDSVTAGQPLAVIR